MKLGEIIRRVQRQFGDDVEAQITEQDIVDWVNAACLEIVTNNATNQGAVGTTDVLENVHQYPLPPDLVLIRSVRINGIKLTPSTYEQLCEEDTDIENTKGSPTAFWVYDNQLMLYPIPDEAYGKINILYVKTPDILTVGMKDRVPDVPVQYHIRIVEYCIAQAAELDDNVGHYQLKMSEFRQNINASKQNSETPEGDSYYPSITYVPVEY